MDSLKPIEIVVSFSSLSYWNELAAPAAKEETKTASKLGVRDARSERDSRMGEVPSEMGLAPDVQLNVPGNCCFC